MIRFRALEPSDADILYDVENNESEWRHGDTLAPYSRHQLYEYALTYDPDPFRSGQIRLVAEDEAGNAVGLLDLYEISAKNRNAFVGIYILPDFRKKGFGEFSLKELREYAFATLGLESLGARILTTNRVALRLFEKAGFKKVGVMMSWQRTAEGFEDVVIMQLTKEA